MASDIRSIWVVSIPLMDAVCGCPAGVKFIFIAGLTHQKCIRSSHILMAQIIPRMDSFVHALSWQKAPHVQQIHVRIAHLCTLRTEPTKWLPGDRELPADITRHHGNTSDRLKEKTPSNLLLRVKTESLHISWLCALPNYW